MCLLINAKHQWSKWLGPQLHGNVDPKTGRQYFNGYHGWTLKYNSELRGFKLSNVGVPNTYAIFNKTRNYPMGLENWIIIGDESCEYSTHQTLLLSSCSFGEFTCNDGSCISLDKRCNKGPNHLPFDGRYVKTCSVKSLVS